MAAASSTAGGGARLPHRRAHVAPGMPLLLGPCMRSARGGQGFSQLLGSSTHGDNVAAASSPAGGRAKLLHRRVRLVTGMPGALQFLQCIMPMAHCLLRFRQGWRSSRGCRQCAQGASFCRHHLKLAVADPGGSAQHGRGQPGARRPEAAPYWFQRVKPTGQQLKQLKLAFAAPGSSAQHGVDEPGARRPEPAG